MTETLLPLTPLPSPSSSSSCAPPSADPAPAALDPRHHRAPAEEVALARAVLDGRVAADDPTDALLHVLTGARSRLAGLLQVLGEDPGPTP